MTKLTRTILSNNPELKVALLLHCLFFADSRSLSEDMGKFDTYETGMEIEVPL
jgi:hypothetical protein